MSCDPGEYEKERFILCTCCLSIDQTRSVFYCRCGADRPVDGAEHPVDVRLAPTGAKRRRLARIEVKRRLPPNKVRGAFQLSGKKNTTAL